MHSEPDHASPEPPAASREGLDEQTLANSKASAKIDRARYRRVRSFFAGVLLHALWWDGILNRPLLRRLRPPALKRWRKIASRYRKLAIEMGGVLIKLGQFLSTRVDILPQEIIRELAGLQDEVPAASTVEVVAQLEEDFQRPLDEIFAWFSPRAVAAASLAQVHSARLAGGEEVVVKVLRPGIDVLVETDLAAFARATRWLRLWGPIRRRVDVAWIEKEFTAVTRRELSLLSEGRNSERFADDFADDPQVEVPKVYWSHTADRTLTMANVAFIKASDPEGITAAGIDRSQVAKRLYAIYMRQFFVTHFVHADPHPGNIFIKPLPHPLRPDEQEFQPGQAVPLVPDRPFQIVFVDFGMTTVIPERLRHGLREFAIGLGTRDARRIVESYRDVGALLPGADIERLVRAHEEILDRFWGIRLGDLRDVALAQAKHLLVEYHDLLFAAPIQLQADMLFASRAVGLLAGITTTFDSAFNPWAETIPFAEQFAREEESGRLRSWLDELRQLGQALVKVPAQLDRLLVRAERGTLGFQASLSPPAQKRIRRLERAVDRLAWMVAGAALLVSGIILRVASPTSDPLTPWLFGGAAVAALIGLLRRR